MKIQKHDGCLPVKPFGLSRHVLAAPSWVMPGSLAENCRFLAGRVDEIGLLFFESKACLAYTRQDLPPDLAALPLSWHIHLPLDLPWPNGRKAAAIALRLMEKAAFLGARRAVLHPPAAENANALEGFIREWTRAGRSPASLLLENTAANDLTPCLPWIQNHGLGFCLDFGHMLLYGQTAALLRALPELGSPAMIHWNAPGPSGGSAGHGGLNSLSPAELALGRRIFALAPKGSVMMAELFDWRLFEESFPILRAWDLQTAPAAARGLSAGLPL